MAANLTVDSGTLNLNITALPADVLTWDGSLSAVWDASVANWADTTLGGFSSYQDGSPVTFDDTLNPSYLRTNLTLSGTLAPAVSR